MKTLYLVALISFLIGVSLATFAVLRLSDGLDQLQPQEIPQHHIHAGFHIYQNGQALNLSLPEYMHTTPCTINEVQPTVSPTEVQLEKAHLHDNVGDVVHSHRTGATWGDLVTNLKLHLTNPFGYINGIYFENILEQPIRDYDQVLITDTELPNVAQALKNLPSLEDIRVVSRSSESCGS
jgi:hypothetical protein